MFQAPLSTSRPFDMTASCVTTLALCPTRRKQTVIERGGNAEVAERVICLCIELCE
jgi:hypothetical protein